MFHRSLVLSILISVLALLQIASSQTIEPDEAELVVPDPIKNDTGVWFDSAYNLTKIRGGFEGYSIWYTDLPGAHHATYFMENNKTAIVSNFEAFFDGPFDSPNITGRGSVNVSALFIGFNAFNVTIYDINNNTLGYGVQIVSVLLPYQKLNQIFTYILALLVACVYINMGATIDLTVVKGIAKKPVGPIVGIICQYGFMPLIAFGLAKLMFPSQPLLQLGMFLNGASPGGGNSNMWTFILGGSLDLSIMMTFVSTLFAFAAVPIWVLSLGPQIIGSDSSFAIPYSNIAMLVVSLVVPCAFGVFIQKKFPKVAKFLAEKVLAKFSVFNIIFIFTFGLYTHRYIFGMFSWRILVACFALPGLGYLSGFLMSLLTRRTWKEIIAITIETGVQNATIAIIILKFTLDAPEGDLTVVIPACCVIMTPIPLVTLLIIKKIYIRCFNSGGKDLTPVEEQPQKPKIEMISNGLMAAPQSQNGKHLNNGDGGYAVTRRMAGIDNPGVITQDE